MGLALPGSGNVRASIVALGLGANAWLACVAWPGLALSRTHTSLGLGAGLSFAALLTLLAGTLARWREQRVAARWLLLCAYPGMLGCSLASISEPDLERAQTTGALVLAAVALATYLAGACVACRAPLSLPDMETHPLGADAARPPAARRLRDALVPTFLLGAFAIAVIAPRLPAFDQVASRWHDAAAAGAVLSAVAGGVIACAMLSVYLGSMLRRDAGLPPPAAPERRMRVAMLLFVALLGTVVYLTVLRT